MWLVKEIGGLWGRLSRSRLARFRELVAEAWTCHAGDSSWVAPDHAQAWVRRPWRWLRSLGGDERECLRVTV